jgi:hypothetical protein
METPGPRDYQQIRDDIKTAGTLDTSREVSNIRVFSKSRDSTYNRE